MFTNHKSEVLVATPLIKDDMIFTKSVIYLCQNDKVGAMGLIINKPLPDTLGIVFEELDICHKNTFQEVLDQPLYMGGPISTHKILILHSNITGREYDSTIKLSEGLSLTASIDVLKDLAKNILPEYFLPVVGYSCWTAEQLIDEVKANDWIITNKLDKEKMFHYENKNKWQDHIEISGLSIDKVDSIFNYVGHA